MAFFPLKKIGALTPNRQIYLRGVNGYNAGWVRDFESGSNVFYPAYVTARVAEGENSYHVEVGFDADGEAEYYECNCAAFHPREGACKHIIAALVHKYYTDMVEQLPTAAELISRQRRSTDPLAAALIDEYVSHQAQEAVQENAPAGEPVVLTASLALGGVPQVFFSVGNSRGYAIRRLDQFAAHMRQGDTVEYGKQLTLCHRPECFDPGSLPLLRFLLGELAEQRARDDRAAATDRLSLTPGGFDRFFDAAAGQTVVLRYSDGDRPIRLTDEDPVLTMTVQRQGEGASVCCEPLSFTRGQERLYLLAEDTLCRTSAEYTRRMERLIRGMRAADHHLYIAEKELPSFCAGVLGTVRGYVRTEGDTDYLEAHRPLVPEAEICLTAPEEGMITARVLFRYGEKTVEPYREDAPAAPWRNLPEEAKVQAAIRSCFTAVRPRTGELVFRGKDDQIYDFVHGGVETLRRVAAVYSDESFDRLEPVPLPRLRVGVSLLEDLLTMDVALPDISPEELEAILAGYREHRPFHRLRDGRFLSLTDPSVAELVELTDGLSLTPAELLGGQISLPRCRALYLEALMREHDRMDCRRDESFRGLVGRFRSAVENEYPLPAGFDSILRQYQKKGYCWLRTMEELGFGGILADDMGLGKTVQIIALLAAAREAADADPAAVRPLSLVVCPTSVVLNWEREIRRFAPTLAPLCVIGDAAAREQLLADVTGYDVLITSYDMLKRDIRCYEGMRFRYHVLDEAQYIKNSATQNAKAAKAIRSVQRFALTGTPVENRLSELWSIFDFLMPGLLFSYTRFRSRYETPITRQGDTAVLERLSRTVSPFILRRLKRDVLTELPPKTERVMVATMEEDQRRVYLAALAALRARLESAPGGRLSGENRITVLAMLTRLRQICCDPRLCCEGYTGGSCKAETCIELIREALDGGHKVLLFSQFTSLLDLLAERLTREGVAFYRLQGSTPKERRAALVDAFNTDDTPVFLISLKAGGTGLNLTGADMVIHYDPWWNLSAQNQATDRAHRIGQKNPVQVVRLIARDTVEEKIADMQEAKQRLAEAVVDADATDIASMSAQELLELLS